MIDPLKHRLAALCSCAEFHSLRYVQCSDGYLSVHHNVSEPPRSSQDRGATLYVRLNSAEAYTTTNGLSAVGLQAALEQAKRQVERTVRHTLFDVRGLSPASGHSQYRSPNQDASFPSFTEYYELLVEESVRMSRDGRLMNRNVFLEVSRQEQLYLSSAGAEQYHGQCFVYPDVGVTAYDGHDSQARSFGGHHAGQQGGTEVIECLGLVDAASRIVDQVLQLLAVPNTPSSHCDLLLMSDRMIPQIHGSTGHPLELDHILGDERNYVGTSFIKTEDFGRYQYGSSPLDVSFDLEIPEEPVSYRQDDDDSSTRKEHPAHEGRLLRPLDGALSQHCSGLEDVANGRANGWNHVSIDRIANLSLESGNKGFAQLAGGIERGVLMSYNRPWSIDNTHNRSQFGCEWDQLIEDGELRGMVKNPNYRGISAQFWCSFNTVGDTGTFGVLNTPYCGEGGPNQMIRVGHISPACVFNDVNVFRGDA